MQFLDFKSILTEIGQTSPLNLMAIFLKRFNLVLDRSLDWIIKSRMAPFIQQRDHILCDLALGGAEDPETKSPMI